MENNSFSDAFIATNLPPRLREVDARRSQLSDIAVIESQTSAQIGLNGSDVKSVVDENGNKTGRTVFSIPID